jgi:hypothetical protein
MQNKDLKTLVKEFLDFPYQEDEENLPQQMFNSEYPEEGSKWNSDFDKEVLAKAKEFSLEVQHEEQHGGEGEGESYWSVYSFTKESETVYVKFDGWYQSYNGSEYDGYYFVEPKQVMVTRYEKID